MRKDSVYCLLVDSFDHMCLFSAHTCLPLRGVSLESSLLLPNYFNAACVVAHPHKEASDVL